MSQNRFCLFGQINAYHKLNIKICQKQIESAIILCECVESILRFIVLYHIKILN